MSTITTSTSMSMINTSMSMSTDTGTMGTTATSRVIITATADLRVVPIPNITVVLAVMDNTTVGMVEQVVIREDMDGRHSGAG
ncbi:uncharacterized protein PGRI_006120 [Penicillium griseofulvum]|uniref:Uncharacterized protein n=1 Tax=Penicillium patulum TaxID=5078 RepID=A0A135LX57_PENPA|nr:uncharacterized protein PGRI_006120 [Penicillium griseofulvum]KXG53562.1 hypothetical protein PGRI_006120 [Penicillium griseofulvum]